MLTKVSTPASQTCSASLMVPNIIGLHARPAAMLVKTAAVYDAKIEMESGGCSVNAKSILGIMTLGARQGTKVRVTAQGRDADEAVRAIEDLFACAFHEKELEAETAFCGTAGRSLPMVGLYPTAKPQPFA